MYELFYNLQLRYKCINVFFFFCFWSEWNYFLCWISFTYTLWRLLIHFRFNACIQLNLLWWNPNWSYLTKLESRIWYSIAFQSISRNVQFLIGTRHSFRTLVTLSLVCRNISSRISRASLTRTSSRCHSLVVYIRPAGDC